MLRCVYCLYRNWRRNCRSRLTMRRWRRNWGEAGLRCLCGSLHLLSSNPCPRWRHQSTSVECLLLCVFIYVFMWFCPSGCRSDHQGNDIFLYLHLLPISLLTLTLFQCVIQQHQQVENGGCFDWRWFSFGVGRVPPLTPFMVLKPRKWCWFFF